MLNEFSHAFAYLILSLIFVAGGLFANKLLRPSKPSRLKLSTYECGEDPVGSSWMRFNIRFYVVALIFILFDVELVFLFPWALVFKQMGWLAFSEMVVFLAILLVGFAYAWVKGDLEWIRPKPYVARLEDLVAERKAPTARPEPVAVAGAMAAQAVTAE